MTNRPSWTKTVFVYLTETGPTCQGLAEHVQKSKRLIVELQDGIIPEGLLVRDSLVFRIPKAYPTPLDSRLGELYRVKMWRHWDRTKGTFLVDFELATEEEVVVHEVMTG